MAPRTLLVLAACIPLSSAKYSLFHAVDDQSVVCPVLQKPNAATLTSMGMTGADAETWPTTQEYAIKIAFDHGMERDQPHAVSFLRTLSGATSVTYQVDDNNGESVVASTTVQLPPASGTSSAATSCTCTGSNTGVPSRFGANYGKTCATHDSSACAANYPGVQTGPWCCQGWCYVNKTCPDAFLSNAASGLYFSYGGACGSTAPAASCSYVAPDPCACINIDTKSQWSAANTTTFGAGYGATCSTWDYSTCGTNYAPDVIDSWCCQSWCWVADTCQKKIASEVWPGLYWALDGCTDNSTLVNTCPFKKGTLGAGDPQPAADQRDAACSCKGSTPPAVTSGRRRAGGATFAATYGQTCSAWDATNCATYFPTETAGIWCCRSWCYVDQDCPSGNPSLKFPGWFWSYEACPDDRATLTGCSFSDSCQPTGSNALMSAADKTKYGSTYGTSCSAWDATGCATKWSTSSDWSGADKSWCCDAWAYVKQDCPGAMASAFTGLFYAYVVCEDPAASVYNTAGDSCATSRRLSLADMDEDEDESAPLRGLAARRRAPSRSFSRPSAPAPRRRAARPVPAPMPAPPPAPVQQSAARRRAPAPTAADAGRRRAAAGSTTYDGARRRAPAGTTAKPPPAAPDMTSRRRTATAPASTGGGFATGSDRRRTQTGGTARRRAVPIGYASQSQMYQNYGGTVPSQTNYGYSGQGPKQNSMVPVAMAGAGGVVAGFGAYYVYTQMTQNNWQGNYKDRSWCRAPANAGDYAGKTMLCKDCMQAYGSKCESENDCYTSQGCSSAMTANTRRDDVMTTGFVPGDYVGPLTLTITGITGPEYTTAARCPVAQPDVSTFGSVWKSASTLGVNLYVTLTQVDNLSGGRASAASAGASAPWMALLATAAVRSLM